MKGSANGRQLQADKNENQSIEDECQGLPDRPDLEAYRGREELGTAPGQKQTAGDDGQYSGSMHGIRGQVSRIRYQKTERNLNRAVLDPPSDPVDNPAHHQTEGH